MKAIQFNFGHPVTANVCLMQLFSDLPARVNFKIDSDDCNLLEIPVKQCPEGKWKLILDWEHNDQIYSHQQEFQVL
jgi:hypothetical protein